MVTEAAAGQVPGNSLRVLVGAGIYPGTKSEKIFNDWILKGFYVFTYVTLLGMARP